MSITDPILIAAAVIPALILLYRVYRADKLEKEPIGLLIRLVLLGVLSTVFAAIAEEIGDLIYAVLFEENGFLYNLFYYFTVVGLAEEGFKYLLLKKRTWNHPAFNCQFDGIVYAVTVSLGFALWENIGYVAMYGLEGALIRAVTAVPGHACFGVFMGLFYGMAKRYQQMGQHSVSSKLRKLAVLVPTALHGCYDFIATVDEGSLVFLGFVVVLFIIGSRMVKTLSRNDQFITTRAIYYGENRY